MAGSASLGLKAAFGCLAITAGSLVAAAAVPAAAGRPAKLAAYGLILAAAGAIFWWLTRRLSRSLAEVAAVARAIADGDYRRRLHLSPGGELATLAETVNHMARSIEAQIATITEQKIQLQAILDSMREGVMVLDAAGRIRVVNPALDPHGPHLRQFHRTPAHRGGPESGTAEGLRPAAGRTRSRAGASLRPGGGSGARTVLRGLPGAPGHRPPGDGSGARLP